MRQISLSENSQAFAVRAGHFESFRDMPAGNFYVTDFNGQLQFVVGENAQLVAKSLPHMRNFSMDPDGKTLAFTAVENGPKASIWVMKNFLD